MNRSNVLLQWTGVGLALAIAACSPAAALPATVSPVAAVTETAAPTDTREPSQTPAPTASPQPTTTPRLVQPTRKAAPPPTRAATAKPTEADDGLEDINAELVDIGYSTDAGQLGWMAPDTLTLVADARNSNPLAPLTAPDPVWANFVLSVDIDWEEFSKGSNGGCGIGFRDQDNFQGQTILFHLTHLPLFNSWNLLHFGNGHNESLFGDDAIYQDGLFEDTIADGSNHYLLVVDEDTTTVHANGAEIGSAEMPNDLTEGEIAFYSWTRTGASSCTFSNGWLWELS